MIILKLQGGLGNQMFQYATAKALADRLQTNLVFDMAYFNLPESRPFGLHYFGISGKKYNSKMVAFFLKAFKKIKCKPFIEQEFSYNKKIENIHEKHVYLKGYFQSENYFKDIRSNLLSQFSVKTPLKQITKDYEILMQKTNSVSLHFRRGDYLAYEKHNTDKNDYYTKALNYIEKQVQSPTYFLFSDDIDWVKATFKTTHKHYFVDFNDDSSNYEDLHLMSKCKHNIIANSSFSWWGAWLNNYKDKIVIAPDQWFNGNEFDYKDVVPKTWVKL